MHEAQYRTDHDGYTSRNRSWTWQHASIQSTDVRGHAGEGRVAYRLGDLASPKRGSRGGRADVARRAESSVNDNKLSCRHVPARMEVRKDDDRMAAKTSHRDQCAGLEPTSRKVDVGIRRDGDLLAGYAPLRKHFEPLRGANPAPRENNVRRGGLGGN